MEKYVEKTAEIAVLLENVYVSPELKELGSVTELTHGTISIIVG